MTTRKRKERMRSNTMLTSPHSDSTTDEERASCVPLQRREASRVVSELSVCSTCLSRLTVSFVELLLEVASLHSPVLLASARGCTRLAFANELAAPFALASRSNRNMPRRSREPLSWLSECWNGLNELLHQQRFNFDLSSLDSCMCRNLKRAAAYQCQNCNFTISCQYIVSAHKSISPRTLQILKCHHFSLVSIWTFSLTWCTSNEAWFRESVAFTMTSWRHSNVSA